ncbi:MAG: hypothetical protein DCF20_20130 [Pseudanabaena sp.]|nr:MAG: hypothetical protein DCF20_20130 [Pseudanabaena sp.]
MFPNLVNFDVPTMIFMLGVDEVLQALILGFLCLLVNQYRGIKAFTLGRIFTIISYFISLSRSPSLSITLVLAGSFLLAGTSITCLGISQFTDKKIKLYHLFIIRLNR